MSAVSSLSWHVSEAGPFIVRPCQQSLCHPYPSISHWQDRLYVKICLANWYPDSLTGSLAWPQEMAIQALYLLLLEVAAGINLVDSWKFQLKPVSAFPVVSFSTLPSTPPTRSLIFPSFMFPSLLPRVHPQSIIYFLFQRTSEYSPWSFIDAHLLRLWIIAWLSFILLLRSTTKWVHAMFAFLDLVTPLRIFFSSSIMCLQI